MAEEVTTDSTFSTAPATPTYPGWLGTATFALLLSVTNAPAVQSGPLQIDDDSSAPVTTPKFQHNWEYTADTADDARSATAYALSSVAEQMLADVTDVTPADVSLPYDEVWDLYDET